MRRCVRGFGCCLRGFGSVGRCPGRRGLGVSWMSCVVVALVCGCVGGCVGVDV